MEAAMPLQDGDKKAYLEGRETVANENTNPQRNLSMLVLWKLMNPQGNVRNYSSEKSRGSHRRESGLIH